MPVNWLPKSHRISSSGRLAISDGISPETWVLTIFNSFSAVSSPISGGMAPLTVAMSLLREISVTLSGSPLRITPVQLSDQGGPVPTQFVSLTGEGVAYLEKGLTVLHQPGVVIRSRAQSRLANRRRCPRTRLTSRSSRASACSGTTRTRRLSIRAIGSHRKKQHVRLARVPYLVEIQDRYPGTVRRPGRSVYISRIGNRSLHQTGSDSADEMPNHQR